MYCKNCGKQIEDGTKFCPECGADQGGTTVTQQPVINIFNETKPGGSDKNKWIAFLLCFFLGGIGAHRFYVGKIGTGILWLCTLGLLGFGALVDLIVILCGNFKDSSGLPLK